MMLSELLHFQVTDPHGETRRLVDLVVGQLDTDYPVVSHLISRVNRQPEKVLPWKACESIDGAQRRIQISSDAPPEEADIPEKAVRLRRDVLDALIIDLQNRRVTRANDLWLQEEAGEMRLSAVDTGARAILRRLSRGRYRGVDRRTLYDWKYIEFLRGDPQAARAGAGYHRRIVHLPPGEIAYLTSAMPYLHAAELLELLPEQLAADTLEVMAPERQLQVLEELNQERARKVLIHMAPDLAADIVGHLDTELARLYLNQLPRKAAEGIIELLKYPENSVGGIMANDVVTISPKVEVGKARQMLREQLKEPDFVYFIYVIEEDAPHKLRGVVTLRQFLVADDDQSIAEIMNPYLITLSPSDSPMEAAYRLLNSQLAALPVVGEQGQLLGTVTIDAAVAQAAPRSWRAQAPRVFS